MSEARVFKKIKLLADIKQPQLDAKDFVRGLLIENSLAVVYGPSGSGKTFWTTSLALHVATYLEFCARRVIQKGVLYCALESAVGFDNRIFAWLNANCPNDRNHPFTILYEPLNLLDQGDLEALANLAFDAHSVTGEPTGLIIIDTLNRAINGADENSADDMGRILAALDWLRNATGACILLIHHTGKDTSRGARGHSSFIAAVDTAIEVISEENGSGLVHHATIVKQRDLPSGDRLSFTLEPLELGTNQFDEPVTTCLVQPSEDTVTNRDKTGKTPTKSIQVGLRALRLALEKFGVPLPHIPGYPTGRVLGVDQDRFRDEFYQLHGGEAAAKRQAFHRLTRELLAAELITQRDSWVWPVT